MKKHLTIGCSFNYDSPSWTPIASQLLNDWLKYDYDNQSRMACGNEYIFHTLLDCIHKNTYDFVSISWTWIERFDLYDYYGTPLRFQTDYKALLKNKESQALDSYEHSLLIKTLIQVYASQKILESYKIPYVMWWGKMPKQETKNVSTLEKKYLDMINCNRFYKLEQSINTPNANCGIADYGWHNKLTVSKSDVHPNSKCHELWSKKIIAFIQDKKII